MKTAKQNSTKMCFMSLDKDAISVINRVAKAEVMVTNLERLILTKLYTFEESMKFGRGRDSKSEQFETGSHAQLPR